MLWGKCWSVPGFLGHSNEVNKGFSSIQYVAQQVVVAVVPQHSNDAGPLTDLQKESLHM